METYTATQGELWDEIAWKVYGDTGMTGALMRANREHLDVFCFSGGEVLRLPERESKATSALPPWKRAGG